MDDDDDTRAPCWVEESNLATQLGFDDWNEFNDYCDEFEKGITD